MGLVTISQNWRFGTKTFGFTTVEIAREPENPLRRDDFLTQCVAKYCLSPYYERKKFPAIVDVKVGKERLSKEEKKKIKEDDRKDVYTIVMFDDGTVERATTADGDEFNLEQGIQICLAKKAFSLLNGNGSNTFNDLVNGAIKLYNNKETEQKKAKELAEQAKATAKAKVDKAKCRKEKQREKRVSEMAEAYARAMKMANKDGSNV